jgi:intergrase/recombinase
LFCKKEGESGFSSILTTLPKMVRFLPNSVRLFPRQRSTRLSYQAGNEHGSYELFLNNNHEFWAGFEEYLLKSHNKHTAKTRILYSKKFYKILTEEVNAQHLLMLPNQKRIHVMKALATLSKYIGCYDKWKDIKERYQLKWSNGDNLETFNNILMNGEQNYTSMIKWLKDTYSKLPSSYSNILLFNALTGLRPEETVQSIKLLHTNKDVYLKHDTILEHYKYPDVFIRRTKKAYISIVTEPILHIGKESGDHSYNALRLFIKRKGLDMNMSFCRKIFATHLKNSAIEQETIDLLQGRLPRSVFARHYFRPDFDHQKIKDSINSLYESLGILNF